MERETLGAFSIRNFLSDMHGQFGTLGINALVVFQNGRRNIQEEKKPSRKNPPMVFFTLILFIVLFWTMRQTVEDKWNALPWRHKALVTEMEIFVRKSQTGIIVVLTPERYLRMDQNPTETVGASARSKILRKFRRFTQTMILELIYKSTNQNMPSPPFQDSPPGWDEYQPKIKFKNISNSTSGEGEVFNKMVFLLQSRSQVPLPSEWEVLLKHYNNLNENREPKESKKALEIWILQKKLLPLLQEYSKEVDVPSVEIKNLCSDIYQKSANVDQPKDYLELNKWDDNALKTRQNGHAKPKQADGALANEGMLPHKTFENKESLEPGAKISECAGHLNQQYGDDQSMKVPHCFQRKRRRRSKESTSQSQELSNEEKLYSFENNDYNSPDDQWLRTHLEAIDPSTFPCDNRSPASDCDPVQQVSSKDNFGINPVASESNSSLVNMNTSSDGDQYNIISEKDYDEIILQFYEPHILIKYLEKYLRDLGNSNPSSRMVELCNEILKKEHGHIDSHTDFFQRL